MVGEGMAKQIIKGLALPGPVILSIGCSEATLYRDGKEYARIGFVHGAIIKSIDGDDLASVGGSDEYGFEIGGIISYNIEDGDIVAIANWEKVMKNG